MWGKTIIKRYHNVIDYGDGSSGVLNYYLYKETAQKEYDKLYKESPETIANDSVEEFNVELTDDEIDEITTARLRDLDIDVYYIVEAIEREAEDREPVVEKLEDDDEEE